MCVRVTPRTNRDGSVVSYLQLAHNERSPETGNPVAKVIHNFGRAENVDRDGLARLVSSIPRFLTPEQAMGAAAGADVEVLDSRHLGGAWTLDRIWEPLGIGAAIRRFAARRRSDGDAVVRVAIEGCAGFTDDAAYAAMDFLLDALNEIASEVFGPVGQAKRAFGHSKDHRSDLLTGRDRDGCHSRRRAGALLDVPR